MLTNRLDELIDQSIALELNVAELYRVFSEALSQDSEFWWQLHMEERSHAGLIRAARDSFAKRGKFPYDLVADSIGDLERANALIREQTEHFKANPPSRREACDIAIQLENEAGEKHYTAFMEKDAETAVENVFQQLNRGDKDHERRIREYLAFLPANA